MENSKKGNVPFRYRVTLSKKMSPKSSEEIKGLKDVPCASAVGRIMYAMLCTCPDIA